MKKFSPPKVDSNMSVEQFITEIDFKKLYEAEEESHDQIGVWVPTPHKEKYDDIQRRSKKKFSQIVAQLTMLLIDKAHAADDTEKQPA